MAKTIIFTNQSSRSNFIDFYLTTFDDNYSFKSSLNSIELSNYDNFIIDVDFLLSNNENLENLSPLATINKPVYFIYKDYNNTDLNQLFQVINSTIPVNFDNNVDGRNTNFSKNHLTSNLYFFYMNKEQKTLLRSNVNTTLLSSSDNYHAHIAKVDNFLFIRDFDYAYSDEIIIENTPYNSTLIVDKFIKLVDSLKNFSSEEPEWVKNIELAENPLIADSLYRLNEAISKLQQEVSNIELKRSEVGQFKKLLYASEDELRDITIKTLSQILEISKNSFTVEEDNEYLIKINDILYVFDVKAIEKNLRMPDLLQIESKLYTFAGKIGIEDTDVPSKVRGVLIINPFVNRDYSMVDFNTIYPKDVLSKINSFDLSVIDTMTLLTYYKRYVEGTFSNSDLLRAFSTTGIVKHDSIITNDTLSLSPTTEDDDFEYTDIDDDYDAPVFETCEGDECELDFDDEKEYQEPIFETCEGDECELEIEESTPEISNEIDTEERIEIKFTPLEKSPFSLNMNDFTDFPHSNSPSAKMLNESKKQPDEPINIGITEETNTVPEENTQVSHEKWVAPEQATPQPLETSPKFITPVEPPRPADYVHPGAPKHQIFVHSQLDPLLASKPNPVLNMNINDFKDTPQTTRVVNTPNSTIVIKQEGSLDLSSNGEIENQQDNPVVKPQPTKKAPYDRWAYAENHED